MKTLVLGASARDVVTKLLLVPDMQALNLAVIFLFTNCSGPIIIETHDGF